MGSFLDKLKILGRPGEDDYADVDLGQFEEVSGSADKMLKVAELTRTDVLPEIKKEIYSGSIVLVDISGIKHDKAALDRSIGEMKKAADDVSGDIAGIGDDLVAIVPSGIRIDREKVVGGKD
jgi:uncharacterized protein